MLDKFSTIILNIEYLLLIFKDYYVLPVYIRNYCTIFYGLIGIGLFLYRWLYSVKICNNDVMLTCTIFIVILSCAIYSGNYTYLTFIKIFVNLGLFLEIKYGKLDYIIIRIGYFIHFLFYLYNIMVHINPNIIFVNSSRNTISVRFMVITILLYLSLYKHNKFIPLYPAIVFFIVCVYGIGRAGIICAIIMVIGIYLINYNMNILFFIAMLCFLLIFYLMYINVMESLVIFNRFRKYGMDLTGRDIYWKEYMMALYDKPFGIFFGAKLINKDLIFKIHSSFFNLHAHMGLGGLIIFVANLFNSVKKMIKNNNYIYLLFLTIIIIRMSVDTVAFFGLMDPIIMFLLFNKGIEHKYEK